ncbi:virulence factor [Streptococcus rupicaprae]|uniref:Virulence factor n=1 Tax=Streptococcus rupicaprae TaxID=759619 RepID=A0ABV2FI65_9STRE
MKKIGIVGIGGISQKAYLPYMRQLSGIEWHVFTRKEEVREEVVALFGQAVSYDSLTTLLDADLDGVMIHAATVAHVELAQLFLKKGIPVYMDKPLTEDYASSKALYDLAEANQTFLMAGFNRRFAPKVIQMAAQTGKTRIVTEKNDINRTEDLQYKLFDLFIHPLDTALFLADEPLIAGQFHYHVSEEDKSQLRQVTVTLETKASTIVSSMNLQSGSRREVMEVQLANATYHLENLDDLTIYQGNQVTKDAFGSWETTLYKRGFETAVDQFLQAIETGQNPVDPTSSLLSHWLCHQINHIQETSGKLDVKLPD